jgi:uncharacterized membrane protein (TIGR02234 family)
MVINRRWVVLLTLLGAGLVLLAGTRTWARVTLTGTLPGLSELTVPGGSSPAVAAIALAAAAGAVVLATSGRVVRFVVAAGLVIGGAAVILIGVRAALDTTGAVATAVRESLGVYSSSATAGKDGLGATFGDGKAQVSVTIWPWVAAIGGVLILAAGLLTLIGGRSWSGPIRRYERTAPGDHPASRQRPAAAASGPGDETPDETPAGTWDALSRGEDPTSAADGAN